MDGKADTKIKKFKSITIEDIAKAAGVSITTVSRVLNDSDMVSRATKKKVQKIIEDMNFSPNAMARGLVKKSNKTLGVMIPDISNPFYAELIRGIENAASKSSFSMYLCITNQQKDKEEYYLNEMIKRRINGLIILCSHINKGRNFSRISEEVEIVSVSTDLNDFDMVSTTDERGIFDAVEYLISIGHRKIGFIGYRFDSPPINYRYSAYINVLKKNNIPIVPEYIVEDKNYTGRDELGYAGYMSTKKLLELKERPTAIQCINDFLAVGAYIAIAESNLKIPEDISIVGFDNISFARLISPQLTTVSQPIYSMGEIAADLLIKNIKEGSKPVKQSIVLPTSLIVRGSTAPPR